MSYYAVRSGRNPGIYHTWDDCKAQVDKFSSARYKKFGSEKKAQDFINGGSSTNYAGGQSSAPPQSYGNNYGNSGSAGQSKSWKASSNYEAATSHYSKPYSRKSYTSKPAASSASWKQNRTAQMVDAQQMYHTSAHREEKSKPSHKCAEVYTDGACSNNGQKKPQAGIGVYWGAGHPQNLSERLKGRQTNNRAEIHAVVKAVEQARTSGVKELTVNTDSNFLIQSMTKWVPNWQRNGWKTAAGKDVINKKDFEALMDKSDGVKINWNHVRGHQGIAGNEAADKLAVAGASQPYTYKRKGQASYDDDDDSDDDYY